MSRCIVTYAADAHEELLDVSLPTYKVFAHRHGYDLIVGEKKTNMPPAWNKIPLLLDALNNYGEVVWFDCDMVVVDPSDDFPRMVSDPDTGVFTNEKQHALVRHFEDSSEVPNSGVWRLRFTVKQLLHSILGLEVFTNHGWWEQAALLTLMGYTVPPEGSEFLRTKCRCVHSTIWHRSCQFMRLCWNSHPNYRAEHPRIVHCSYPSMPQRLEVMRGLVKDPHFDYPKYNKLGEEDDVDNK